jgi:hypothetical protein
MAKSTLVPVGDVDNVEELAGVLGCGTTSLPLKYLGLPLGACFKAKSIWDDIMEKVDRRLASWKMLYLSKSISCTVAKMGKIAILSYFGLFFFFFFFCFNKIA